MIWRQSSGLTQGLSLLINADWTPQQALAVVELLDDLRERICAHYQLALFDLLREDLKTCEEPPDRKGADEPF
ncbi:hypothetical protein MNJPNG_19400 [Cupriavidus oxalaticus]|uniref:hypothetical protein n=1 Tax=Cupriavidus oxalaticus TaxID=96344 RepID=UPI003F73F208